MMRSSVTRCGPKIAAAATQRRLNAYVNRHIGIKPSEAGTMLTKLSHANLDDFMLDVLPKDITRQEPMSFPAMSESEALIHLRALMVKNKLYKTLIGQGYYEAIVPAAILRNVLENPAWYTPYTPYQAEISQGRLESLLNYQTMVMEITKMDISNASLLDQATAAGEAMTLSFSQHRHQRKKYFVSDTCFSSTIEMLHTRAKPLGIDIVVGKLAGWNPADEEYCGVMMQSPDTTGAINDFTEIVKKAKESGIIASCGTDLLACTIIKPPGEMGFDIVYGSAQRFGIPLGYGGPHAAFFAVSDALKRLMPGRLVGVSKDMFGNRCVRMALQTREQHIKREKATSNICTAQALLANMSAFYAIYHGPNGLQEIASDVHARARTLAVGLEAAGHTLSSQHFFDTISVNLNGISGQEFVQRCVEKRINVFLGSATTVTISVDEATTDAHIAAVLEAGGLQQPSVSNISNLAWEREAIPENLRRESQFMKQEVFNSHHTETKLMRYIHSLSKIDYGLQDGMIPLGSCTMKLNAAATLLPLSWNEVGGLHPLVPTDQARGYESMLVALEQILKSITGFAAVSLQPNSGAQGEYSGLRVIHAYHQSRGEGHRKVCLIPQSAHGTNPASAVLAGKQVVVVKTTKDGKVDMEDLKRLCDVHAANLSCAMITYPSTYGTFDQEIKQITNMVHESGGQVYIDGANLNAMVGFTGPRFVGGDVCHINMHKTFSIPHGGGGPGMGPIAVREHLAPFLPNTAVGPKVGGLKAFGQVSQAPYGSASILSISYMLMIMLGSQGLKESTAYAVLNANYLRKRLESHYHVLFVGAHEYCAHEFIVDLRPFKKTINLEAEDVAKRLMDYGFHAPTLAFPVPGTLMIEPTESESLDELERFVEAMIMIRAEIAEIEEGKVSKENNLLKNSPHPASVAAADEWKFPYTRQAAVYPTAHTRKQKFWPTVGRVDGAYGDRHLHCSCSPLTEAPSQQ